MKTSRHLIILVFAVSILSAAEPLVVTKDSAAKFYREFECLTKKPRTVSLATAQLCRTVTKEDLARDKAIAGPHAQNYVHIYANPSAAESIAAKGAEFPVGAVIVKEKLGKDWNSVSGVGGMVKRAKGYDPANGDWEFFYYTPGGEFTTGKLANCVDCHNGGKRDHVFSVWSLDSK